MEEEEQTDGFWRDFAQCEVECRGIGQHERKR